METNLIIRTYRHFPKGQVLRYVWLKATLHRCNSISLLHSRDCQIDRNCLICIYMFILCMHKLIILVYNRNCLVVRIISDNSSKESEIMKNMAH